MLYLYRISTLRSLVIAPCLRRLLCFLAYYASSQSYPRATRIMILLQALLAFLAVSEIWCDSDRSSSVANLGQIPSLGIRL